ncbi:MBL fold metallo-hydrolase [Azospirillum sp. TSO22-1]|uniref:MBL fold metallo-hydrolase n=1 Tax=Azospirillum sp. TSO22-1 TaxID=716789 RepID=UPI000D60C352|nr:MBL fold metallo-hydrolase [Azospirillum sp. TSO22-1]PWC52421.1 hypothetical protein TSO221_14430 [Azospirillum sp. TSO22-1]
MSAFNLHVVQALHGDCLIVEHEDGGTRRFILVDGGPAGVYEEHLKPYLTQLVGAGGPLDLVVLSHVDDDHVVGVLELFADIDLATVNGDTPPVALGELWHNSFRATVDEDGGIAERTRQILTMNGARQVAMTATASAFFGINQGNQLARAATKLGIAVNAVTGGDVVMPETVHNPVGRHGLEIHVIGPNQANLAALRDEWLDWLATHEHAALVDPTTAANADKSVPNLSSIMLLLRSGGRSMLLTGDGRGDFIVQGLQQAGLMNGGTCHVDVLKVQHHGSNRNSKPDFFKTVTADTYVISADGKHGNPDLPTLQWIVDAAHADGRRITLHVTNDPPSLQQLRASRPPAQHGYRLEVLQPGQHAFTINL